MRLFVLGATGRTGTEFVDLALARGHDVTAFVRSPKKLAPRPRLSVVAGDPRDTAALGRALPDHDAVVSVLGAPPREALRPNTMMTDFAASTVSAMTSAGVARLAILSAAVLFPLTDLVSRIFTWILRHHARDLTTMEAVVSSSGLSWTIARPPRLVHDRDEVYRSALDGLPPGKRVVSYRAVAAFLLDAIERREHVGEVRGLVR
jgi:putative NADH-flavin reductase